MKSIQHQDARKLLKLLSSATSKNEYLTYSGAAILLRRPENHSRAVASTCNLLDAAACIAGVPLLALIWVRAQSGDINPEAFAREYDSDQRAVIRNRSLGYNFNPSDFDAISKALDDLGDKGVVRAWKFVSDLYPKDLLYRRLIGDYENFELNAIDDIGTTAPNRIKSETWSYSRNPRVRDAVLRRANGKCEYCGVLGFIKSDGTRYLESHHVIALASDGEDRETNVIALCPNDHREAHFGVRREEIEREMVLILEAG